MTRLQLFSEALDECRKRLAADPDFPPLRSTEAQLTYLVGLESGQHSDRSRLGKITVGTYAAREFEPGDMEFANLLHAVSDQVASMLFGR